MFAPFLGDVVEYIGICSPTDDAKNDVRLVFAQLKRK